MVCGPKCVIARCGDCHFELQIAVFHIDGFSARSFSIFDYDDFVVIGEDGVFGF